MKKTITYLILVFITASVSVADTLSVAVINVWSGLDYQGTFKMGEYEARKIRKLRFDHLVEQLSVLNPDVIIINEANPLPRYSCRLSRKLGYDEIHVIGNAGIKLGCLGMPSNLKEGDAILARKELRLKKTGRHRLSGDRWGIWTDLLTFHFQETNNVLLGEIRVNNRIISIAATHLYAGIPNREAHLRFLLRNVQEGKISKEKAQEIIHTIESGSQRRMSELSRALDYIDGTLPYETPVILAGDLNAAPDSPELDLLTRWRGYTDTWTVIHPHADGYTWDPVNNTNISDLQLSQFDSSSGNTLELLKHRHDSTPRRIDYILLSHHFNPGDILDSRVILSKPINGQYISDHYGVYSEIRIN